MKKITSVASLGLRLTLGYVLALFGCAGVSQWLYFYQRGRDGIYVYPFEQMLDGQPAKIGISGMVVLVLMLYAAMAGAKRSKISYTLRRLQLSEAGCTVIFALIFTGYFVLYWAFQIVMCLVLYAMYTNKMGVSENLLFVSAFRAQHFHNMLPLHEPWALVRNGVTCFCFGSFAALSARNSRNGRAVPLLLFFTAVVFGGILYPNQLATRTNDISLSVILLLCLALDIFWTWRWNCNEAD